MEDKEGDPTMWAAYVSPKNNCPCLFMERTLHLPSHGRNQHGSRQLPVISQLLDWGRVRR